MTKTEHYNLKKPGPNDPLSLADFNENSEIIDAALTGCARVACGTYTGTGTYGSSNKNTLTFDFEPKIVFVFLTGIYGAMACTSYTGSAAGTTNQVFYCGGSIFSVYTSGLGTVNYTMTGNVLTWYTTLDASAQMNTKNSKYSYVAIG